MKEREGRQRKRKETRSEEIQEPLQMKNKVNKAKKSHRKVSYRNVESLRMRSCRRSFIGRSHQDIASSGSNSGSFPGMTRRNWRGHHDAGNTGGRSSGNVACGHRSPNTGRAPGPGSATTDGNGSTSYNIHGNCSWDRTCGRRRCGSPIIRIRSSFHNGLRSTIKCCSRPNA